MKSGYIETLSGKKIELPEPDSSQIDIDDITIALSRAPRFAGHTTEFYSVLKHSIAVAFLVEDLYGSNAQVLQGLMHDATEAYLCDIPTPFKNLLNNYGYLESQLWGAICEKFEVTREWDDLVKYADKVMLFAEKEVFKPNSKDWGIESPSAYHIEVAKSNINALRNIPDNAVIELFKLKLGQLQNG